MSGRRARAVCCTVAPLRRCAAFGALSTARWWAGVRRYDADEDEATQEAARLEWLEYYHKVADWKRPLGHQPETCHPTPALTLWVGSTLSSPIPALTL